MYEITLILAGLLITVGLVGLGRNLFTGHVTVVRRPLSILAFIEAGIFEILYVNYIIKYIWEATVLSSVNLRLIAATAYLILGSMFVLKAYIDRKEYEQIKRVLSIEQEEEE